MIVDIVVKKQSYGFGDTYYVVLDRRPEFVYKHITDIFLQAEDNGILKSLMYQRDSHDKAFSGAKFNINTDRGIVQCDGSHWNVSPKCEEKLVSVGYATQEDLDKCYCFVGGQMKMSEIENFLSTNEPKTDYYAFQKGKK